MEGLGIKAFDTESSLSKEETAEFIITCAHKGGTGAHICTTELHKA